MLVSHEGSPSLRVRLHLDGRGHTLPKGCVVVRLGTIKKRTAKTKRPARAKWPS